MQWTYCYLLGHPTSLRMPSGQLLERRSNAVWNVPSCTHVIDDVIITLYVDCLNVLKNTVISVWGFAWLTSQHASKEEGTYWPRCCSPRSSWRASSCCWRCPCTSRVESWSWNHRQPFCFRDGHGGRGISACSIISLLYFITVMFSFWTLLLKLQPLSTCVIITYWDLSFSPSLGFWHHWTNCKG